MNEWELHLIPYPTLPVDRPLLFRLKDLVPGLVLPALGIMLPSAWYDLAEKGLRMRACFLDSFFQSWLYSQAPYLFLPEVEGFWDRLRNSRSTSFVLAIGERTLSFELSVYLVELLWTLKIRRLQWLRDHSESYERMGFTRYDLEELDELYETEAHYARGRLERGEKDGGGLIVVYTADGFGIPQESPPPEAM